MIRLTTRLTVVLVAIIGSGALGHVDAAPADQATSLHAAVLARDAAAVRGSIAGGADVDAPDHHGRRPLHLAALGGRVEIVGALLDAGATAEATDDRGDTPLHLAARRLRHAAVTRLIAEGADVDAPNHAGRTPLHLLADQGPAAPEIDRLAVALAEQLIAGGADAGLTDTHGRRAVDYAAWRGHRGLTELLTRHSGPPDLSSWPPVAGAAAYHTYPEIEAALLQAELDHPDLCRRVHLGATVHGRDMWALNLSDRVGLDDDEPEVKYVSTMHGDEVMGVEMCLLLIDALTSGYGSDDRITAILDGLDVWIVPCMNPDGFVTGSRYNGNGVDLNRDFPDRFTSPENTTEGRQPETANIMHWSADHAFTLAANFHGGALVVNYPFDGNESGEYEYTATPDDDLFVWISEAYAQTNPPMWGSPYFHHGITNGADWYVIYGGMQDWSYLYMGTNEVTIEVSDNPRPPANQIPQFWAENSESMLAYLETALIGVRGLVTDRDDGGPLAAAVTVLGRDHRVYTDPDVGNYHRMLLPGTYDLRFESETHDPRVVTGILVETGAATRLDVPLGDPAGLLSPNGGETLALGASVFVTWTGQPEARFHLQHTSNYGDRTLVNDGFETGLLGAAYETGGDADWLVTTEVPHDGAWSARAGDIGDRQVSWLERVAGGGMLSFWYRVSSEAGYDFFDFEVDGERRIHASGTGGSWTRYADELPPGEHTLRWTYVKDGSVSHGSDTVWIDDLAIVDDLTVWTDIVALTDPGVRSLEWTPTVESETAKVRVRARYEEGGGIYGWWDESDDTFTVSADACPADLDGSGAVDFGDLLAVLAAWGSCPGCPEDLDGDEIVGFSDLLIILGAWGPCP